MSCIYENTPYPAKILQLPNKYIFCILYPSCKSQPVRDHLKEKSKSELKILQAARENRKVLK